MYEIMMNQGQGEMCIAKFVSDVDAEDFIQKKIEEGTGSFRIQYSD